jgi:hypothetical protein
MTTTAGKNAGTANTIQWCARYSTCGVVMVVVYPRGPTFCGQRRPHPGCEPADRYPTLNTFQAAMTNVADTCRCAPTRGTTKKQGSTW